MNIATVILAAGKGTRMKSKWAKVLFPLAGKALVEHVADTATAVDADPVVVVAGYRKDDVIARLSGRERLRFAEQTEQLGTGHAVLMARQALAGFDGVVFILCGDVPLLRPETLRRMLAEHTAQRAACTVLTMVLSDPGRYGRIVRDAAGNILRIVEYKDATEEERAIREINTGIYCYNAKLLFAALDRVGNDNQQHEYYLTDTLELLNAEGEKVIGVVLEDVSEAAGVNSQQQLAELEEEFYRRVRRRWLNEGVVMELPSTILIEPTVTLGRDVTVGPHCVLRGCTTVGEDTVLGPGCLLSNATLGEGCILAGHNVISGVALPAGTRLHYGEIRTNG